jgi:hypothetical protein
MGSVPGSGAAKVIGSNGNGGKPGSGKGAKGGGARPNGRSPQPAHANVTASSSSAGGKIGRNDPCYCGSGKKYKMCHGR